MAVHGESATLADVLITEKRLGGKEDPAPQGRAQNRKGFGWKR
jgi:hypothetical protein